MIHKALITAVALLSIGVPAAAQTNGKWAVDMGERVRLKTIRAPDLWLDGNVIALDGDTLWLAQRQGGERLAIPAASIRQLEVSRGRKSNFVRGLGIGLAGGAVLGAAMGLIDGDDPPCPTKAWFCFRYSAGEKAAAGALVGGGLGAIVGGIVGATTRSERWAAVRPADLLLTVGVQGDLILAGSYRF